MVALTDSSPESTGARQVHAAPGDLGSPCVLGRHWIHAVSAAPPQPLNTSNSFAIGPGLIPKIHPTNSARCHVPRRMTSGPSPKQRPCQLGRDPPPRRLLSHHCVPDCAPTIAQLPYHLGHAATGLADLQGGPPPVPFGHSLAKLGDTRIFPHPREPDSIPGVLNEGRFRKEPQGGSQKSTL